LAAYGLDNQTDCEVSSPCRTACDNSQPLAVVMMAIASTESFAASIQYLICLTSNFDAL
jgi:hypothetical protein